MAIDDNTSYELTGYQVKDLAQKIRAKADSSSLASVATSGLYSDLTGAPTIPTVYNGTLTIQQNGTQVATFTANQSSNATANITVPTDTSDLTNTAGFITSASLPGDMTGATSGTAGAHGLVPAPSAGDENKVLSGAGTWVAVSSGGSYSAGNGISIDANNEISIDTAVVAEVSDIPTVNDGTLTIQQNGTTVGTFSANQSANETINITSSGGETRFYADFTTWDPTGDSELYIYKDSAMTQTATNTDLDAALVDGVVYIEDVDRNGDGVFTIVNYNTNTSGGLYSIMEIYEVYELSYDIDTGKFHMTEHELQGKLTAGTNVTISGGTISATDTTYSAFTGATSSVAGTAGLVPAPTTSDPDKYLKGDGTWAEPAAKLVEMSYGEANSWAKFIAAYQAGSIVYCRASSNANPATGTQGRKAFMAYVNNATSPTEVEFQYVRSVNSKTDSQQSDQVFIYKLTNASGGTWTVTTRNMAPKINVSGPITKTFTTGSNPTVEIGASAMTGATSGTAGTAGIVPAPAAGDEAKVLSGAGTWVTQPTVNDATLTIQHNGTDVQTFTANSSTNKTANIETIYADDAIDTSAITPFVTDSMIDWSSIGFKIIAAGTITVGTINASSGKRSTVNIPTQPDTNYVVMLNFAKDATNFASCGLTSENRTTTSFGWFVWNNANSATASLDIQYLVVKIVS